MDWRVRLGRQCIAQRDKKAVSVCTVYTDVWQTQRRNFRRESI